MLFPPKGGDNTYSPSFVGLENSFVCCLTAVVHTVNQVVIVKLDMRSLDLEVMMVPER